jgi:hypothetical protein
MTKKTNVIVSYETDDGRIKYPHLRVKVDGQGFPYVYLDDKYILSSHEDREFWCYYGMDKGYMKVLEGRDELKKLLENPELTTDKLSVTQLGKIS